MPIISAYHKPNLYDPAEMHSQLDALQDRASVEGWGGSDMEWAWCDMPKIRLYDTGWPGFTFPCPICHSLVKAKGHCLDRYTPLAGQCPDCGIIWWW